mmetsp:Transcript_24587/g.40017  ORF Transcript_24587/g.40017 Transcript_24587/m.40017 type:complete len:111 (+) Transcript_24587:2534-2866(+)
MPGEGGSTLLTGAKFGDVGGVRLGDAGSSTALLGVMGGDGAGEIGLFCCKGEVTGLSAFFGECDLGLFWGDDGGVSGRKVSSLSRGFIKCGSTASTRSPSSNKISIKPSS